MKDRDSIVGKITFDDHGQNTVPVITKYVVQDGKFVEWDDSEYAAGNANCRGKSNLTQAGPRYRRTRIPFKTLKAPDMDAGLFAQFVMNGLMLGMMYALVAVGFTLFFGVLDIIKFSHGDVLTVGGFSALASYVGLRALGISSTGSISSSFLWFRRWPWRARDGDRPLSGHASAFGAGAQHTADHADGRNGAARMHAAVLSAGRQSKAFSRRCCPAVRSTSATSICGSTISSCSQPAFW